MFIEVSDKESGVSTGEVFYVSSWGEPNNADIVSSLKIKTIHKSIKPVKTLRLNLKA